MDPISIRSFRIKVLQRALAPASFNFGSRRALSSISNHTVFVSRERLECRLTGPTLKKSVQLLSLNLKEDVAATYYLINDSVKKSWREERGLPLYSIVAGRDLDRSGNYWIWV